MEIDREAEFNNDEVFTDSDGESSGLMVSQNRIIFIVVRKCIRFIAKDKQERNEQYEATNKN